MFVEPGSSLDSVELVHNKSTPLRQWFGGREVAVLTGCSGRWSFSFQYNIGRPGSGRFGCLMAGIPLDLGKQLWSYPIYLNDPRGSTGRATTRRLTPDAPCFE